jgi:hypothetical protein
VSKCPRTCATLWTLPSFECSQDCAPGCRCPAGTFLDDNKCVKAEECKCSYMRKQYAHEETTKIGCNEWYVRASRKSDEIRWEKTITNDKNT